MYLKITYLHHFYYLKFRITKLAIIIILLLIRLTATGQDFGNFTTKQEITKFINWKIKTDNKNKNHITIKRVNRNIVVWDSAHLDYLAPNTSNFSAFFVKTKGLDSILTANDFEYIEQQLTFYFNIHQQWKNGDLNQVKLVKVKPVCEMKKGDEYWEYSIPIFSKDHSMCIIQYNYISGSFGISWRTTLFKKTQNGWEEVQILYGGES